MIERMSCVGMPKIHADPPRPLFPIVSCSLHVVFAYNSAWIGKTILDGVGGGEWRRCPETTGV
jgi:hypothetical protein